MVSHLSQKLAIEGIEKENARSLPGNRKVGPSTRWILFYFLLFTFYGSSLSVLGQLRYVEVVLLVIAIFNIQNIISNIGVWERRLIFLFLLSALAHIVADQYTGADMSGTIKRSGTYFVLALLLAIMSFLTRGEWLRIRWILLGYCLSYYTLVFIGSSSSLNYSVTPWRLGLGAASTMMVCIFIAWHRKHFKLGLLFLTGITIAHVLLEARSLALISLLVVCLAITANIRGSTKPLKVNVFRLTYLLLFGLVVLFAIYKLTEQLTNQRVFPAELQVKMEQQFSNPYGLIAAARPDTAAALFAIKKSPLIGFGTTNVDSEVFRYYSELSASSFSNSGNIFQKYLNREWTLGTPSHSHLLGAWVDAGFFAMICWLLVFGLAIYTVSRASLWKHQLAPLVTFVAISTCWDVIFSPGPHRMDIVIKLLVLLFALHYMNKQDLKSLSIKTRMSNNRH